MLKCFLLCLLLSSCGSINNHKFNDKRELRGVWVATVANIDWPKNNSDQIEKKKKDFIKILDFYKKLNFNAIIVQIRTAGDAFYPTDNAPWSKYLIGQEEQVNPEYNNILTWMIKEAHVRGFEFHAWLNPYRASIDDNIDQLSKNHDIFKYPEWMVKYGNKYYYNPGIPSVKNHLTKIINEVIVNYNVDAIHFDDYFYPYKIKGETFNDTQIFEKYKLPNQTIESWRRSNVDSLVKNVHNAILKNKPWIHFGISPFGVWKNKDTDVKGSDTKTGQTTFDDLYADPLLWMKKGWIDYIVPQIYWSIDYPDASHKKILNWWNKNTSKTNLYVGYGIYKIRNNKDEAWNNIMEIPNQISLASNLKKVKGNVFFSAKSLMDKNEDVVKILREKFYTQQALTPKSKIFINEIINKPQAQIINSKDETIQILLKNLDTSINYLLVYQKNSKNDYSLENKIFISDSTTKIVKTSIANYKNKKYIYLSFLNRNRTESSMLKLSLTK